MIAENHSSVHFRTLVAFGQSRGAQWELVCLRVVKSGLVGSLKRLNEKDDDLRTLEMLPTDGVGH